MSIKTFLKIIEPKTFGASVLPVWYGSVFSWYYFEKMSFVNLFFLTIGMMLVQGATNMINDYFDHQRESGAIYKVDEKALASGEVSLAQLKRLIEIFLAMALLIGVMYSVLYSGWIFLIIIMASLVMFAYSSGPMPLCYTPFGEVAAGITMGLGITGTVIFIQSGYVGINTLWVSLPTVFFVSALLLANNLSDWREDQIEGRKTTVILLGEQLATYLWLGLLIGMSLTSGSLVYLGLWPMTGFILTLLPLYTSGIFKTAKLEKNRNNKRFLMGSTSRQGLSFHLIAMFALIISRILS